MRFRFRSSRRYRRSHQRHSAWFSVWAGRGLLQAINAYCAEKGMLRTKMWTLVQEANDTSCFILSTLLTSLNLSRRPSLSTWSILGSRIGAIAMMPSRWSGSLTLKRLTDFLSAGRNWASRCCSGLSAQGTTHFRRKPCVPVHLSGPTSPVISERSPVT